MSSIARAQTTQPAATRPATTQPASAEENPAAPGFDREGSDPEAIAIADAVMEQMGGRQAWDDTRYIRWNFFEARRHLWDKQRNRARIEGWGRDGKEYVVILDLETGDGKAWSDGKPVTDPLDLSAMLAAGMRAWINDSYWLLMPYKLKDSGVTLKLLGDGKLVDGRPAQVLELTFTDVGNTPQNKYHVWVARNTGLVEQWAFFSDAADSEPRFTRVWKGWEQYGKILLSSDRGALQGRPGKLTDIAVFDWVPEAAFTSEAPVKWPRTEQGE